MQIPVAHLVKYGSVVGSIVYDNETNKFFDSNVIVERNLPYQNYIDCSLINNNCVTVVGKVKKRNTYICCFGDNFCYELTRENLLKFNISNMILYESGKLICKDKLTDLSHLFPDGGIKFLSQFFQGNSSSQGISRKFNALYRGKFCIVKFSKSLYKNKDLENEIIYKDIAKQLGIKVCNVYLSEYYGKKCCISIFEYDITKDVYISFKNFNRKIEDTLASLNKQDRLMFDKYLLLDYIMHQQDRHLSNLAVVNNRLYPLFDNGECLNIGSIGYFSMQFRSYIERLDKNYLKGIINQNKIIIDNEIVKTEVKKIWGSQ